MRFFLKDVWAVGQGGMASGVVLDQQKNPLFSYVYDCGSNHRGCLSREMQVLGSRTDKIDLVFLSHLDNDHVNGFDELAQRFDLSGAQVVLPYMDAVDIALAAANSLEKDGWISEGLTSALDNVNGWIQERAPGARITYIGRSPGDNEDTDPPVIPTELPFDRPDTDGNKVSRNVPIGTYAGPGDISSHPDVRSWIAWRVGNPNATNDPSIELVTYALRRSASSILAFQKLVEREANGVDLSTWLKTVLRNKTEREALRDLYSTITHDHNTASLHLLVCVHQPWRLNFPFYSREDTRFSMLFTGDAKLKSKRSFDEFKNVFGNYLGTLNVLFLPHHGAESSFHPALPDVAKGASLYVQVGGNPYGHPSSEVYSRLAGSQRGLRQVNEDVSTRLQHHFVLGP